ncbi:dephospho-CoA kinase [Natronincola peptidivorans]|uniref:Dephospho-CoA kinase n=1 Tax=Natronincola peptidivorans TaxID=426128 RepID=A0A1I0GZH0_9FIRM|nr:dephospho-CoA kinase [Natronincola peptidivorans]SET75943.1 dephospho-CoA kinase [Natronincola peptidivorans]
MKIIGLTGGIATGKSTVSKLLKDKGAIIIDADIVARKIVEKGKPALNEITENFGKEILLENGELDRRKLGRIVFNDPSSLKKLNEITHPKILQEIQKEINYYKQHESHRVIIIDAALLIETNMKDMVDEIWLVTISEEIQRARLMKRDSIGVEEASKRMEAQMSIKEKLPYAHKIIDNSGDLNDLEIQVKKLWEWVHK